MTANMDAFRYGGECVFPSCPSGPGPHAHQPPWAQMPDEWSGAEKAEFAERLRKPQRDAEWAKIVAERGDEPEECGYCGLTTRPFSEWAADAECTKCHGTLDRPPDI